MLCYLYRCLITSMSWNCTWDGHALQSNNKFLIWPQILVQPLKPGLHPWISSADMTSLDFIAEELHQFPWKHVCKLHCCKWEQNDVPFCDLPNHGLFTYCFIEEARIFINYRPGRRVMMSAKARGKYQIKVRAYRAIISTVCSGNNTTHRVALLAL